MTYFRAYDIDVSIHAPVRERLSHKVFSEDIPQRFNPRPRKGATTPITRLVLISGVSIHAPVRERRRPLPRCH